MRFKGVVALALALCVTVGQCVSSPRDISGSTGGTQSTIVNFDSAGNQVIRFDVDGNAIDAHEGNISLFGNTYYFYGTGYGCGFRQYRFTPFCGFKVYSSTDLVHWTDRGTLFDATTDYWQEQCGGGRGPTGGGCYRPQVVYDAHTNRYVLWFSLQDVGVGYHVMESASPIGPFVERPAPQLAVNNDDAPDAAYNGDETLFVDDDGTAYLVHSDWHRQGDQVVEQLDNSYESGTGRFVRLGLTHTEAPTMFKRNGRYYIMVSDPNCPFCTGTGSMYMTAPTPLGPWTGVDPNPPAYWQIQDGVLHANGGDFGFSTPGGNWTDYSFAFDTEPITTTDDRYARSGWVFRAQNKGTPAGPATNGYLWSLSNDPSLGPGGGSLIETVLQSGSAISRTIPLTFPVTAGQWYHVQMDMAGSVMTTTIDGQTVDVQSDTAYTHGHVGFMESTAQGESALFKNVSVTAADGTPLLSGFSQFDAPLPERTPISISANSCGGQPTHVAVIPGANGPIYLYQSDLWSGGDTVGLANYYWAPLSFNADGSIAPIACEPSATLDLAVGTPGYQNAPADLDQTSGVDGFQIASPDVFGPYMRLQAFTPSRTGTLSRLSVTAYNSFYGTTAPLLLDVVALDAQGRPSATVASDAVPADDLNYSARDAIVMPNVPVEAGRRYGILIHSATAQGSYGVAYNDANPYPRGVEEVSTDGGATWTVEPGRALKFSVSVTSPAPTPTITSTATPLPIDPTAVPPSPTGTSVPATVLPMPPTATPVLLPTVTPVLPPTATPVRPSPTPLPATMIPAPASPTSIAPTEAPVPRTATPVWPTATAHPTEVSFPTPLPDSTPGSIPILPSRTPMPARTPPVQPSSTPSTKRHVLPVHPKPTVSPPLALTMDPKRLISGTHLLVTVHTSPHARVFLKLEVTEQQRIAVIVRVRRVYLKRTMTVYEIKHTARASSKGVAHMRLYVTYAPPRPQKAHLTVTVSLARASRTRILFVPISRRSYATTGSHHAGTHQRQRVRLILTSEQRQAIILRRP